MGAQHTPGPWVHLFDGRINSVSGIPVADAIPVIGGDHVANVALITAAPDMLAALEGLFAYEFRKAVPAGVYAALEAAMKKARGE